MSVSFNDAVDGVLDTALSIIGAVVRPFLILISAGLSAVEALFGQSDAVDGLRGAVNDFDEWFESGLNDVLLLGFRQAAVAAAAANGLELDSDEPFSEESLTGAFGQVVGYEFQNIFDKELLTEDVLKLAAFALGEATGLTIDDLRDPDQLASLAAQIIVGGAGGALPAIPREAVCESLNDILEIYCKTPECHPCMDDFEECIKRREKAERNREKNTTKCKRSPRK